MCGIAGAVGDIDSAVESGLDGMLLAQIHRGPDDSGKYLSTGDQRVLFGFRRLAILDLSIEGHQPMVDERTGNVVVFNGEIYNFAEIRQNLESEGYQFRSKCDTEVLLQAYAHHGADVVHELRGMYAFAVYDRRNGTVFLARDRLGIKPLYYTEVQRVAGNTLLFASEVRSLLASGLVARKLDRVALSSYMWNGFVVGPRTIVEGVSLLPAGCSMLVDVESGRKTIARYWSLGPRAPRSLDRALGELESELLTASQQHLVSDVPLGIFLSGGVDSSAVAALATRTSTGGIKTFHISFEEPEFDESKYARRVADSLGTEHSEYRLTQSIFVSQLDDALGSLDQPTLDAINTYFVSRVVREAGFTVALAGTGGDELFGGYASFKNIEAATRATKIWGGKPAAALGKGFDHATRWLARVRNSAPPQTRWAKLGALLGSRGDKLNIYQTFYGLFTPEYLASLQSSADLATSHYGIAPERRSELEGVIAGLSPLAANSVLELALFLGERLLRDSDVASMATSLELRVPLLDHRVVEAIQRVPDDDRFAPLGRKLLLRRIAMPNLDPAIFERKKAGFVLPIAVWAKDRLAKDIESTFEDRALVESVGLHPETLQRLWRSFVAGAPGLYWSRIWAPYVLLRWCRSHCMAL